MINDRMVLYDLEIRASGYNEYGEPKTGFEFAKEVEVSISLITKIINELDARYTTATHLGLSYDKELPEGAKLTKENESYMIRLANNDGRMAQLTLEKI